MPNQIVNTVTEYERSTQEAGAVAGLTIEGLLRGHYAYVLRLANSILEDAQEAEDAAQETFIAANRALSSYRADAQVTTWLTAIAVNVCRGHLRRRKIRLGLQLILGGLQVLAGRPVLPEEAAVQNEADRQLWQAVDSLDEKHRLPIILHYVHDLTAPEIAAALGISQGTVHSRLHYAHQKLSERLGSLNRREESIDESVSS